MANFGRFRVLFSTVRRESPLAPCSPVQPPSNAIKGRGLVVHPRWGNDGSWRFVLKKSAKLAVLDRTMRPARDMEAAGIELTERN
jgi:hypothetical protein